MAGANESRSLEEIGVRLGDTPQDMLNTIKRFFSDRRALCEVLSLEHHGICYRVWCDDHCFMVYRANDGRGSFHHVPGWPVCLVTSHSVYEEAYAPTLGADHHACELDIARWLEVVAGYLAVRKTGPSI